MGVCNCVFTGHSLCKARLELSSLPPTALTRHLGALNTSISPTTKVYYRSTAPYEGFRDNSTTWCYRHAVLLGSNMFGFPDMVTAYEYRRRVYERFGLVVNSPNAAPRRVMILDRNRLAPRHFLNLPAMQQVIQKYPLAWERVEITARQTFQEQVSRCACRRLGAGKNAHTVAP